MGHGPRNPLYSSIDSEDITVFCGFFCIVGGVAWRYDGALALIVFGIGLLLIGILSIRRHA